MHSITAAAIDRIAGTYAIVDDGGNEARPVLFGHQLRLQLQLGARLAVEAVSNVGEQARLAGALQMVKGSYT